MDSTGAAAICEKVLSRRRGNYPSEALAEQLRLRADEVIFSTDDFLSFFTAVALDVGIDVGAYGARLNPKATHPYYIPGAAFRTVAEIAGVYVEHPHALTFFKVQRAFLVTMTAALIGIATGKVIDDPTVSSALGGVGALLVNILAQRYLDDGAEPETDWLEEFILVCLERHGPQAVPELHKLTHVHRPLLTRTLRGLVKKKLVVRAYRWTGGRTVIYGLPGIAVDRR